MNLWNDSAGFARQAAKVESAQEALLLALLWWRRDGWTVIAQHPIREYRIDLFIPEAKLAIEVDSFEGHGSGAAMERDAEKRNAVVAAGWAPYSRSARQILREPTETLWDVLAEITRRIPPKKRPASQTTPVARSPYMTAAEKEQYTEGASALLKAIAARPKDGDPALIRRPR